MFYDTPIQSYEYQYMLLYLACAISLMTTRKKQLKVEILSNLQEFKKDFFLFYLVFKTNK